MASSYAEFIEKPISEKVTLVHIEPSERLLDWVVHSGSIYSREVEFFVVGLEQEDETLTQVYSLPEVIEGTWFFDDANKDLYFHAVGNINPDSVFTVVNYRIPFSDKPTILPIEDNGREVEYLGLIRQSSKYDTKLDTEDQIGVALESSSQINMINDGEFWSSYYDKLFWENKPVSIYSYGPELEYEEKQLYFKGIIQDKSFSDSAISFRLKDFLNQLRESLPLPLFTSSDGDLPDSVLGKAKRRIYGRAAGLKVTSLNQVLDGYEISGTWTSSVGDNQLIGVGGNALNEVSPDDEIVFGENSYSVELIIDENTIQIGSTVEFPFLSEPLLLRPEIETVRTGRNTEYQIAHHALRQPVEDVIETIQFNRIKINDASDFQAGDLVQFSDTGLNRFVKRVTTDNVLVLEQTLPTAVVLPATVTKFAVQKVFAFGRILQADRDYTIQNLTTGSKLTLDPLVEFNLASIKSLPGTMTFTNGSSQVTATGINFKDELKPRDWIKPDDITISNWLEVLQIIDETTLEVRSPYADANFTGDANSKVVKTIGDNSVVTVDCYGKTEDGTATGTFLRTASHAVQDMLTDLGLSGILNTDTFDQAKIDAPFLVSLALPLTPESSAPKLRDSINLLNKSVFGSLVNNENFLIEYNILGPNKPAILPSQVIKDDDILSWSIKSTSKNITQFINTNYRHQDADRFTEAKASSTITYENEFVKRVIKAGRTQSLDVYLYESDDAQIITERKGFINEISQSIITLKGDLKLALKSIGDIVLVEFDRLYDRFGSEADKRKICIVSGISKDGSMVQLELDDIGNIWNRVANITDDTANDFIAAQINEKLLNGYITDTDELISNDSNPKLTYRLNLIG